MQTEHYCLILFRGAYMVHNSRKSDQLDGPFPSIVKAWLAARAALRSAGSDPSAVLDLTTTPYPEIKEYLR